MTVPQVRMLIAGLLNRKLKVHQQGWRLRTLNRRLKRNEEARFYHWKQRNCLAPRRLEQGENQTQ